MATLADVQNTYLAINRAPLDASAAAAVLAQINQGQISLATYTNDLIQKAGSTTGAAIAISAFVTGIAPTSKHLDELKVAADAQVASYKALGVANSALGAFEAFGKGFAADTATGFASKYGALSTDAFITAVYNDVFGKAPAAGALANFQAQITYFSNLYTRNGVAQAQADLQAKGAVLGQIVGYAFVDPAAAAASVLDDKVAAFLTKAVTGDLTVYGAALPSVAPAQDGGGSPVIPAPVTVTIDPSVVGYSGGIGIDNVTFSNNTVNFGISLGDGDDRLTAPTGILGASAVSGGNGTDVLVIDATAAATASGSGAFAARVTGFEQIVLTGSTNQSIDLATLGNYNHVTTSGGNGETFNNMASGGTLILTGAGTAYTVANAAFTASPIDVINLILKSGSGSAISFASTGVTTANVETVHVTVSDTQATPSGTFNEFVTLLGNSSKSLVIDGNAGLSLTATSTALTSVDASGITLGGFSYTSGALASAAIVKGSATGTNTVDFSAATNSVTYTGGSAGDSVTGGVGSDTLTGGGGVDTFSYSTNRSTLAAMDTITDYRAAGGANAGALDIITVTDRVVVASNINTVQDLSAQASLINALNVFANAATTTDGLGIFKWGGDTYVFIESTGATTSYVAGDTVIKLAGAPFTAGTSIVGLGIDGV